MKLYFKTIPKHIETKHLTRPHIRNTILLYSSTGIYESDYKRVVTDNSIEDYTINKVHFIKDTSTYTKTKVYRIPFDHIKLEVQTYSYVISSALKLVILYSNDVIYNIYFETDTIDTCLPLIKDTLVCINK